MGSDLGKRRGEDGGMGSAGVARLAVAFLGGCLVANLYLRQSSSGGCTISLGQYKGTRYTTTGTIGQPKCLIESKFLKVQLHRVQLEKSATIIDDWLWIDYHDRINVLVEAPRAKAALPTEDNTEEPRFLIFEQTKYALEDRMSLAIVGGLVEPGEAPETAARREVREETGHECARWQFLGRYRTDVNRGIGWTNTYLARDCQKQKQKALVDQETGGQVGGSDMERQDLRIMTLEEVMKAAQEGRFLEIQWSATVALAILHYSNEG
jgi:ADP-ribose pyrophosphatase